MPLARTAVYAQHCDIYLAPTWDNSDTWVATLRIAKEGGQFVIGVAPLLRGSDVLEELRGTLYGLEEVVYADLDIALVHEQRRMFDPVGHYARPDVFALHVDTRARNPVVFDPQPLA
jgi:nitrilase